MTVVRELGEHVIIDSNYIFVFFSFCAIILLVLYVSGVFYLNDMLFILHSCTNNMYLL